MSDKVKKIELAFLELDGNKIYLEKICEHCNGSGVNPKFKETGFLTALFSKTENYQCPKCAGSGCHRTENGERLIRFILNNLGCDGTSNLVTSHSELRYRE